MLSKNESYTLITRARSLRNNPTDAETRLWQSIRRKQVAGLRFRRQVVIGQYITDFCCPDRKFVIELDGGQHLDQQEYDARRTVFLESKGYTVLRFWDDQIFKELDAVLQSIYDILEKLDPQKQTEAAPLPTSPIFGKRK